MPGAQNSSYSVRLSAESMRTLAKLRTADLMPELRRELTVATAPLQPATRAAARALPSGHKRRDSPGGSLRSAVAASIVRKIKLTVNSAMIVIYSRPSGGKSNLARLLEGEIPWTHPTYGHDPVVNQKAEPFFYRTIDSLLPRVSSQIETVLTKMEAKL